MNENNPIPPQMPPQYPSTPPPKRRPEPGDTPEERVPITNPIAAIEAVLRHPRRLMYQLRQPGAGPVVGYMILVTLICALVYGVVVGSFSMHDQLWRAPVKVAGGLMFSTVICLPSLYIFACLSGSPSAAGGGHRNGGGNVDAYDHSAGGIRAGRVDFFTVD